MLVVARS